MEDRALLATFTVTNTNDTGAGSLRAAVTAANATAALDDIEFNIFALNPTITLASELVIDEDLIIDGTNLQLEGIVTISGGNANRIFYLDGTTAGVEVHLRNMELIEGFADSLAGAPVIQPGRGGAILNEGTTFTMENVGISDSIADLDGGAVLSQNASTNIRDSRFFRNEAKTGDGGAIHSTFQTINIFDSVFDENEAGNHGGAVKTDTSTVLIQRSTLIRNEAILDGGGIHNDATFATVDSTWTANVAGRDGGAIYNDLFTEVLNSTLSANTAVNVGGGIYNGNSSTLTNSTITQNIGENVAGGISSPMSSNILRVFNTIVAGNESGPGGGTPNDIDGDGVDPPRGADGNSNNNLIGDALTAGGMVDGGNGNIVGADVNLAIDATLADNGGPTFTHQVIKDGLANNAGDDDRAAWAGVDGEPSVAAGDNPLLNDQRGTHPFRRIYGGAVDIGAYEQQPLIVDTGVDESDGDHQKTDFSLREAIEVANDSPGEDEIVFELPEFDPVIVIDEQLIVTSDIIINGVNIHNVGGFAIIDGNSDGRIMWIDGPNSPGGTPKVTLQSVTFRNGHANGTDEDDFPETGGAILNEGGELHILGAGILDNQADLHGGAVMNIMGGATQGITVSVNSTISGNSAAFQGGAFYNEASKFSSVNSTITSNTSGAGGGGIFSTLDGTTESHLYNTIVAGNIGPSGPEDLAGRPIVVGGAHNLIGSAGFSGGLIHGDNGNIVGNLGLGNLDVSTVIETDATKNGGPTLTHALVLGSPALNVGHNNLAAHPGDNLIPDIAGDADDALMTDARIFPFVRVYNGTVDIGAVEDQELDLIVDTHSDELDSDYALGDFSLREALRLSNENPRTDTVTFALPNPDTTIRLDEQVIISGTMVMDGSNTLGDTITLDGRLNSRIMLVDASAEPVSAQISNMTFTSGVADGSDGGLTPESGGAILSRFAVLDLQDVDFLGNSAFDSGGAIYNEDGVLLVTRATFDGNDADRLGGAIGNDDGIVDILVSTLSNNHADIDGGAIFNNNGPLSLVNSTVSGNTANLDAGGIYNEDDFVSVVNSTIVNNRADADDNGTGEAGGLFTVDDAVTDTHLFNALIAGNVKGAGTTASDLGGKVPTGVSANNLIGDAGSSAGLVDGVNGNVVGVGGVGTIPIADIVDPILKFNGGPTQTHSVQVGSPAIDVGDANRAAQPGADLIPDIALGDTALVQDQRGAPYTRFSGASVDAGAYEVTGEWVVDTHLDIDNADYSPGDMSLREAIFLSNATPGDVTITFDLANPNTTILLDDQLTITSNIVIDGSNASGDPITLDGQNAGRILNVDGLVNPVTVGLTNLTFTNGNADGSDPAPFNFEGGAVLNQSATLWVSDTSFIGNSAADGGGIMSRGGTVSIENSFFSGNGAVRGAGFLSFGAQSTVEHSRFTGNTAVEGGAIFSRSGTTNVNSSTVWNNSADIGGGLANELGGNLFVTNSTVSGNVADDSGGGIFSSLGFLTVTNSTVALNTANADQDATGSGGGVHTDITGTTRLYNTLVAGNVAGDTIGLFFFDNDLDGNVVGTSSHNLIADSGTAGGLTDGTNGNIVGIGGAGTILLNDILDPNLQLNGGSATMTHALVAGSAAIDGGDSNRAAYPGVNRVPDISADGDAPVVFDQRDTPHPRVTGPVDIGAYEVTQSWVVNTGGDLNDGLFGADEFSLREAVDTANANPGPDVITFDIDLSRSTIDLTGNPLVITEDLVINGLGAQSLTIDAGGLSRVFEIVPGVDVELRHMTLTGGDTFGNGGAILSLADTTTLEDMVITGNSADIGGGLYLQGAASILRTEISNNTARLGGGISSTAGQQAIDLENVTVSGNTATDADAGRSGGGIFAYNAVYTLLNSTVANNTATANGGGAGIAVSDNVVGQEGSLNLINSIVGENTTTDPGVDVSGPIARLDHSLIETNAGFTVVQNDGGNLFVAPELLPLGLNSGQTATHELGSDSPAADAGDNTEVGTATDQAGQPRQSGTVDMGARERLVLAVDDGVGTNMNTPILVDVLDNDNPSTNTEIRGVSNGPSNGTATVTSGGVSYNPNPGYTGSDMFDYSMGVAQIELQHGSADSEQGQSVAVAGDWLVTGATSEDGQNPDGGGAAVYRRTGGTWTLFQLLDSSDEATLDRFGYDVAIDGTTIVVGARMADAMGVNSGAAYVFEFDANQNIWIETEKLLDTVGGKTKDQFGHSVAISGDTIVIGSRLDDGLGTNAGSAFVFERSASGWGTGQRIVPSDSSGGDQFGFDVAIDGDTLVVGSRKDDTGGIDSGSVYVFERTGNTWTETTELFASNTRRNNWLGFSVDIDGDTIAAGMPIRSNRFRRGEVLVFERDHGGTDNWGEIAKQVDTNPSPELDQLGYEVAIDGDTIVAGARRDDTAAPNGGRVYMYSRNEGGADAWGLVDDFAAFDAKAGDNLGTSVALDGGTLAMGAPLDDDGGILSGSVYISDLRTETATVTVTVNAPLLAQSQGPGAASELTQNQVDSLLDAARAYWQAQPLTGSQFDALNNATVTVDALDGNQLGLESGGRVVIDTDGAGYGWYVDPTPYDGTDDYLGNRMDLLTTVTHELGHVIGRADLYDAADAGNIMYGYLSSGEQRVNAAADTSALDLVFGELTDDEELFNF